MSAPIVRPGLKYLPCVRMSGNSPRRLAVVLVEREAGCLGRWNVEAGSQVALGAVETDSGVAVVPERHRRADLAVLIVQVHTGSTVRCEVNGHSRTAVRIGKVEPDCAVGQNAHRSAQLAAAVAQ